MLSPTKQNTNFKILIVDSSDNYLNLYTEYLQSISEKKYQIVTAHNWQDAWQLWRSQEFDLAIIEIDLPDGNGLELLAEIAKNTELTKLPIIITNQEADQELTITAMQRGASDFFVKNNITQVALCRSVNNVIEQGILAKKVLRLQQREEIINKISASVYQFFSLTKIYQLITQELQIFLEADRILIYKFQPGQSGRIVAETVIEPWSSCMQANMIDQCFAENWQKNLQLARLCFIADVNTENIEDCYRQFLQTIDVQANLVVPIILPNNLNTKNTQNTQNTQPVLWGVIIAHQCSGPRIWDEHDINLLERLCLNLGIALQQAELYENLQYLNQSLENKVRERTVELETMIDQYQQVEVALSQLNQELEARVADRTQDLQDSENRLLEGQQFAHMGTWQLDITNWRYTCSRELCNIFRINPVETEITYEQLNSYFVLADRQIREVLLAKLIKDGQEYSMDFEIIRGDGTRGYVLSKARPDFDESGKVIRVFGIIMDITERKETEAEILKNRNLWEAVFNESADALFLVDYETLITIDCNARAVEMFEANIKDDLINQCGNLLQKTQFTSEEIATIQREMNAYGFWTTELEYVTLQGNVFWGSLACTVIMVAGQVMNLMRVTDISQRKRLEQELIDSQSFIQTLINTIPLPLFWKDRNSHFLGCNYQFLKILGLSDISELVGKTNLDISKLQETAKRFMEDDQKVITTGKSLLGIEQVIALENGEKIWLETNKAPLQDSDNQIIGLVGTLQDITERKRIADNLQESNRQMAKATRMKDEFLANMSHELRTPLNAILGMSEVLLEQIFGQVNSRQEKAIKLIEKSGKHLLDLINDILDLSKIEAGKFQLDFNNVSVIKLCTNSIGLVEQMANQKNIILNNHITTNIKIIWVDERRIQQILLNLLSNAIKFTPPGGQVSLLVSEEDNQIVFSVVDNGIGIAENDIDSIFQPFIQIDSSLSRQYTGTGLGLALVKKIVDQHQGSISVNSKIGEGTCFTIRLPYYLLSPLKCKIQEETAVNNNITDTLVNKQQLPLVLIADDNEGNQQTTKEYLVHKEYRIILANNGEEAINLTRLHHPDIILMDIQMPKMDGLTAIQIIRSDSNISHIPIIAISALSFPTDVKQCLEAGANEYVMKPVHLKKLLESIEKLISVQNDQRI